MPRVLDLLERRSLTQRLFIGFAAVVVMAITVGLHGMSALQDVREELRSLYEVELRSVSELKEAQLRLTRLGRSLRQAILDDQSAERELSVREAQESAALTDASIDEVRRRSPPEDADLMRQFEVAHASYRRLLDQAIRLVLVNQVGQAQSLVASAEFVDAGRRANQTLTQLAQANERRAKGTVDRMDAHSSRSAWLTAALLGVGLLVSLWVAYQVSLSIQQPLQRLRDAIDELARGRLDVVVPHAGDSNELGSLAKSVVVLQGKAQSLESELWVKSQVTDITGQLQEVNTVDALCQRFVDLATPRLQAALASIYLLEAPSGVLRRVGAYALDEEGRSSRREIRVGEGLVGACAQSGRAVSLAGLPEAYARVQSGTGGTHASHLELRPVGHAGRVQAVVEFAALAPLTPDARALLDALLPILSLNLEILDRSRKTENLLAKTQQQEDALRVTEAWFRSIIESAPDGMLVVDSTGVITLANASAASMFGYGHSELVGMQVDALVPLSARGHHASHRAGYLATGGTRQMGANSLSLRGCRKYGTEFPVEVGLATLPEREGKGPMVCVSVRDITQRKQEERVLARQRAAMQKVLENSPIGMVIEADNQLRYVNPEFAQLFGVNTGDSADRLNVPVEVRRRISQRLRDGETLRNIEFRRARADGQMGHFLATYALIDHEGTEGTMGWVVDISERARVERLKKEFISTVSHELRTPLTSIRGSLSLVVNGVVGELPAAAKPLIQIAHHNSERLILLVNDILDMEKLEAGRMDFDVQEHELMPLVHQAVDANRPYAQQHQVEYAIEETDPQALVRVDANRFMQVLANLLSNAAKFSSAGQRVSVGVTRRDDQVRIEVRDRGPGISEEFRGRIFQKFAQADSSDTRKKGGTGLGLNITKSMVERMGGRIGFESEPHVLTTFFIEFPVVQPAAKGPAQDKQEAGAVPEVSIAESSAVLVCEDDPDIASLLRMMLQQGGLVADVALSAAEAKSKLAAGRYRALTVDLDLPDQSGTSLIQELRDAPGTRDLPIVVVSAHVEQGRKALSGDAFSVVEFIDKPIDERRLGAAMRRALRGGGLASRPRVLHVEDDPDIVMLVKTIASDIAEVISAGSVAQAQELLSRHHFDLAILDLSLPDGDGFKLVPKLNSASPPVPVVVFSAREVSSNQASEQKLKAALLKSRDQDSELLATIRRLIGDFPPAP